MNRHRKMSMPLEFMELSPTKRSNQEEKAKDFYDKPYARCIRCLQFKTRCPMCLGKVLQSLKCWKDGEKVKLKESSKSTKKAKIIRKSEDAFNISNISVRKSHENAEIVTFQQPVLHKNTILYCVNPFSSPQPKVRSPRGSPSKYRRNLYVNYTYRDGENMSPREQTNELLTEVDIKKPQPTRRSIMNRLATTMMTQKRNSCIPLESNPEQKEKR